VWGGRCWGQPSAAGSASRRSYAALSSETQGQVFCRWSFFWQSPRTRKQARPDVRLPTARAQGVADLEILVDSHERYPYTIRVSKHARCVAACRVATTRLP
jgi:hypothetical protein